MLTLPLVHRLFGTMLPSHHGFKVAAARSSGSGIGWSLRFGAASSSHHAQKIAQHKFNESCSRAALARLRATEFLHRGRYLDLPPDRAFFAGLAGGGASTFRPSPISLAICERIAAYSAATIG
jgi:hypothetical protein